MYLTGRTTEVNLDKFIVIDSDNKTKKNRLFYGFTSEVIEQKTFFKTNSKIGVSADRVTHIQQKYIQLNLEPSSLIS